MNSNESELVKVTLVCGREGSDVVKGYPGDCETNTSNQTQATCC